MVGALLEKYGVRRVYVYEYSTTVRGRRYRRWKVVVRDRRVVRWLARAARDPRRIKLLLRRYRSVVREVILTVKWVRVRPIIQLVPRKWLMEWLGIKPYEWRTYERFRRRALTLFLKPNWRGWYYYLKYILPERERGGWW